jgi:hypothetical protein
VIWSGLWNGFSVIQTIRESSRVNLQLLEAALSRNCPERAIFLLLFSSILSSAIRALVFILGK